MTRAILLVSFFLLAGCGQAPRLAAPAPAGALGARAIGCLPGDCPPRPTCKPPRPLGAEAICPPGECGTPRPTPCR